MNNFTSKTCRATFNQIKIKKNQPNIYKIGPKQRKKLFWIEPIQLKILKNVLVQNQSNCIVSHMWPKKGVQYDDKNKLKPVQTTLQIHL